MALDPLKFQVAIQDDATGQLNKIEQEFQKLKDKTISVKVEGVDDLQRLLQMLGQQTAPKIGEKVSQEAEKAHDAAKKVGDAAQTTSEQLQKLAQSAIKGSFEQFVNDLAEVKKAVQNDNFTAFTKRIEGCAEAIGKLTEAFATFKATIGENKELKDLLTGWGAAIKEVSAAMAMMNAVKNGGMSQTAPKEELKQQEEGLVKLANAMGRVRDAASGGGVAGGSIPFMESINKVGERNIQTLIKEQGHIERLIAIAKKSIDFGEGHPVLGMGRLRGDQMQNLQDLERLKKVINEILFAANQGDQAAIRFLNTLGSLKTTPFGKDLMGNDITLLGGHFDKLTHNVTGTATAMRELNANMRLDNAEQFRQWNTEKLTEGLHKVNQAIADIKTAWEKASGSADAEMTRRVAEQVNRLNEVKSAILSALSNNETLRTPRGYQQVINANNNEQINQAKRLRQEIDGISRAEEKQAKDAERYTEQQKRAYEKAEKDKAAAVEKTQKMQEQAARQTQRNQENEERNQQRINNVLSGTIALKERMSKSFLRGQGLGVDTSVLEQKYQQLMQMQSKVLGFTDYGSAHAVQMLIGEWNALQRELKGVVAAQEKVNNAQERANKKAAADALKTQAEASKQAQKENEKWAESARRAGVEVTNLEIKIRKLKEVESKGSAEGVDTTALKQQIAALEQYLTVFRQMANGFRGYGFAGDLLKDVGYQSAVIRAKDEAQAVRINTTEKERNAAATSQMSSEEQRLAQALNQTTESAKGQSQVLSDLKSMATQYLGVWGGQQFLHNIIEIGGQLEMQRLSIGAILQNTAQANELFDKIKHLATQSPFGVVQLDQMTKQLTAYGFKYNELYDMTKRLADISAATGTDVSRLALALGHVRSEAALSGYTLRQFSMANVPLLQKLSEKLGKTTKEIREMVKKKEVGYDDVIGVLKDLTNEGGMFYNMQEVISESVKAKFKNVKDVMDIMYGEMAEGAPGDALKEVANVLMELTQNWKDVATVMGTVAVMWGVNRAATLIYTKVLGTANATTLSSIAAFRAKEAEQLRSASLYRTLTSAEKSQIATSKLLTTQERIRMALHIPLTANQRLRIQYARQQHVMDLALALSEKKLTAEDIARQVALGKITKAEAAQIIALSDLTNAQKLAALEAVNNTRVLGFWGKAGYAAALGIRALGTALKSLIFNPAMLAMAGITAVMELWQRNKQELERAGEIADSIRERSNSAMQATKAVMQSSKMEFEDANGNKISPSQLDFQSIAKTTVKVGLKFDEEEAQQVIDEMADYIRQYSATPNEMLNNAFFDGDKMRSKEEQFRLLAAAVGEVAEAQYGLHDIGDVFENAINATNGGWFDDDIVENINDYEKAVKNYNKAFADMYREHGRGVDKIVKAVEKSNSAFATAVSGMNTYGEKFKYLIENMNDFSGAYNTAREAVQYSDNDLYNFLYDSQYGNFEEKGDKNWAKSNMDDDLEVFFTHIEAELNNKGVKIGELTKAQQEDLLLGFTDFLSNLKVG